MPVLGAIRFDLLLVVLLFLIKFLKGADSEEIIHDESKKFLNYLMFTIILITPFSEWPGSVLTKGLPNLVKAAVFFYFTIWFVDSQKKLLIFLATFIGCQTFRFMEPLYLHITQGYWGSRAYMGSGGTEFMDRLSGAPSDVINPNGLAFVVMTVLPFAYCFYKINIYCKIFMYVAAPPALYVLLLTGSRSALLAILVMGLFLFYKSDNKLYFTIGAVIAIFLMISSMSDIQVDRYRSIFDSDTKNAATSEGRLGAWSQDFTVVLRKPFFGHGLGTSLEANANFAGNAQPSHNIFLEVLQELGVVGFFMFIRYVWSVIKSLLVRNEVHDDSVAKMLLPIKSAFSTLAVMTIFFGFASFGLSSFEWYFIGGCVVVINKLTSFQTANNELQNA